MYSVTAVRSVPHVRKRHEFNTLQHPAVCPGPAQIHMYKISASWLFNIHLRNSLSAALTSTHSHNRMGIAVNIPRSGEPAYAHLRKYSLPDHPTRGHCPIIIRSVLRSVHEPSACLSFRGHRRSPFYPQGSQNPGDGARGNSQAGRTVHHRATKVPMPEPPHPRYPV